MHTIPYPQRLGLFKSIGQRMTERPAMLSVLRAITKAITALVRVDVPLIYIWDQEKDDFGDVVYGEIRDAWRQCSRNNSNGSGWNAIHQGTLHVVKDADVNEVSRSKGIQVTAAYPIRYETQNIAVLYMDYIQNPGPLDERRPWLERPAKRIGRIMAKLNFGAAQSKQSLEDLKDEFAEKLREEKIVEEIDELMRADFYLIVLYDTAIDTFGEVVSAELSKQWETICMPRKTIEEDRSKKGTGLTALERAEKGEGYLHIPEHKDIHWYPKSKGVTRSAVLALTYERRRLGVIYLHFLGAHPELTAEQRDEIEIFGHLASAAIKNALWLEDHKTLLDIMKRLTSSLDLNETAKNIARGIVKVIPGSIPKVYLCDPEAKEFELLAVGRTRDEIRLGQEVRPRKQDGIGVQVMLKKVYLIRHTDDPPDIQPRVNPKAVELGSKTVGCWPLVFKDKVLGLVYLHFKHKHLFTEEEILKCLMFANQTALAIHNATVFEGLWEIEDRLVSAAENLVKSIGIFGPSVGFEGGESFENLTEQLEGNPIGKVSAKELEELFRKLFWEYERIMIVPIDGWGFGGAGVVKVRPERTPGSSRNEVVVKFGRKGVIEKERRKFKGYVQGVLGGNRYTSMVDFAETLNLAAIGYTFVGTITEEVQKFDDYYRERHHKAIETAIQNLFGVTCERCHSDKKGPVNTNLRELYTRPPFPAKKELIDDFDACFKCPQSSTWVQFENDRWMRFPELDEEMVNPLHWLEGLSAGASQKLFHRDVYLCVNHGDLRGPNIFVDYQGNCWLIDFANVCETHLLNDFTKLEATVKFELLYPQKPESLKDLLDFERLLLQPKIFSEMMGLRLPAFKSNQEELCKAFVTIKKIRELAFQKNERDDMHDYYVALFFHSLMLCRSRVMGERMISRTYALLSASLLAEKLEQGLRHQVM